MIEDILNSYQNGNFSQMKDQINESDLCMYDLVDELKENANDTDVIGVLKLFLIKEGY